MSTQHKTPTPPEEPHMEKQIMTEPVEEFITDMPQPSVDKSAQDKPVDVHSAGHQEHKSETFEPGVEG